MNINTVIFCLSFKGIYGSVAVMFLLSLFILCSLGVSLSFIDKNVNCFKTTYLAQVIHNNSTLDNVLKKCWISCVPSSICCFVWKLVRQRIPTKDELFKRNIIYGIDDMICVLCKNQVEIIDHLFISCDFTMSVWNGFYSWLQTSVNVPASIIELFILHDFFGSGKGLNLWRVLWFDPNYVHIMDLIHNRSWV
ncbi:unnamed protein product [Lupinus luteus]|uniref:Reverse transcriptase zinc-binding domain-containing protein n=1 Tax=Lupinus luteus TaxID=3873 RepID=A0AAV1WTB1_LUPLU